ncbi:MAG: PLP-dependent transferase [Candidatus Zixiibacteriota bacterium]|nr:MAG: PLP-dependent transferase [candidate division Zixibacteria bacterium]
MSERTRRFETIAIQSGEVPEDQTGAVTTPIHLSTTYRVAYPGDDSGYVYSRSANPTRRALESTLAALENGKHGFAFASGLAAVSTALHLLKSGDHIVASSDLYGGTHRQFDKVLRKFGLDFTFVDGRDPSDFEKAVTDRTTLFWIETPSNPLLRLINIAAVSGIGRQRGILTVVDNTFATPYIQQPLGLGADVVMHSASKYLAGHCDVIGGALVTSSDELGEKIGFHQNALGAMLGPFESWLVLRGLKTLSLRMERHSYNASRIASYLSEQDSVSSVMFPGHDNESLPNGMKLPGGMVSFELNVDFEAVKTFACATRVFVLAESLGGVESLINHPASMTHASVPPDIRKQNGIGDGLIRLSVGTEHIDDLLDDLEGAFKVLRATVTRDRP